VYVTHDQTEAMTLGDRVAVMRSGLLQQVGPPQELYSQPANLFVAGFIGSPAMNFLPAHLENDRLRTTIGDLPLSDRLRQAVSAQNAPRDLIVGIRPEAFEDAALVSEENQRNGITFRTKVDVVESMGSDNFVYFAVDLGGDGGVASRELEELAQDSGRADTGASQEQIVARLDAASRVREGSDAEIWADARAIHVFDPQTGQNLGLEREPQPA
jgi:multiple sugar transport system ATP-binding protein